MDSNQIRNLFTSFFEERGHVVRPSASLIPIDPTLLVTNAGMVPFKPYFLGEEPAPYPRATTVQKVVRTIDIDIIGSTQRHLSFFEMLGNFSFGDYFKAEAIPWSYEFVTERLGLDPERLWFTVHESDDEAEQIWIDSVGAPPDRVQRGGKDNFWQMGVPGPCGPCSEIFWDKGEEHGPPGGPIGGGEERYLEIWNLVFMQNIQDEPYHVIGRPSGEEHRHRDGPGEGRFGDAGGPQCLRHRHHQARPGCRRRVHRPHLRRERGPGRLAPHPDRPRAIGDLHDRRWSHPLQRRAGLRAAPASAPGGSPCLAVRRRGSGVPGVWWRPQST